VLKPARWASVVFHNSDDKIWQTILDATQTAGLELVEINSFDKEQLSFKGVRGSKGLERVTNKDIVLNLRKPSESNYPRIADVPNTTQNQSSETDQSGIQQQTINPDRGPTQQANGDTEIRVVEQIAEYLSQDPMPQDRSLQALWNTALGEMIRSGAVDASMDEVGRMLPHYFKEVDGRWYLRGETVMGGNVFDLRADADAIAWLAQTLQEPKTIGDLIPQWQMLTAQSKSFTPGRLERLLEQNFWLDKRTGRWRIPSTQEREKMSARSDLKGEALLRTVRRYLAGQLPQMPMPMELALWVRECYKREAYEEASGLFNNLDASQIDQGLYRELKRIVAVCQSRLRTNAATDGGNRDVGSIDI
jgi:hypothetical protein